MGINPLKLLEGAAKAVGGALGIDVEGALDAIKNDPSPEVQARLADFDVQMRELALQEMQTEIDAKVDLMVAEIQSEDAYVRRARPTGLYVFYAAIILQTLVTCTSVFFPGMNVPVEAFLSITTPLAGYSGWYAWNRSNDKKNLG
jgi:hypothetical protein